MWSTLTPDTLSSRGGEGGREGGSGANCINKVTVGKPAAFCSLVCLFPAKVVYRQFPSQVCAYRQVVPIIGGVALYCNWLRLSWGGGGGGGEDERERQRERDSDRDRKRE